MLSEMFSGREIPEDPYGGEEQRDGKRFRCSRPRLVRLLARPSFQSFRAVVHNVSARGLGLILGRALEVGTVLAVQLRGSRQEGLSCILTARVQHCTRQANGNWLVGC